MLTANFDGIHTALTRANRISRPVSAELRSCPGGDVPRHVGLSALLQAGLRQADQVATDLAEHRATELAQQLQQLQQQHGQ